MDTPSSTLTSSSQSNLYFTLPEASVYVLLGDGTKLYQQMLDSYGSSLAPGTLANRLTQAKTYICFAVLYDLNPLKPSSSQLCMFTQYLKNSFAAPATVKNYLSGARTWIAEHGGDLTPFGSI